jgi:oxygen-dependent protoporphyrinogen oxidase
MKTVVVVGSGIAGLTVCYELLERAARLDVEIDLRCLESGERAGGNIRTDREDGFLYEWGATGFLDNAPATVALVGRLGLDDRVLKAHEAAARRYIFRKGKLREVPLSPGSFLTSGVLSPLGKLRLLMEPCIGARREQRTETVFDFAARRIGRQAAAVLVDAMVSGVFAGNARQLELETTFPQMRSMESEHGSLFRAMLAKRKESKTSGGGPAGPGGRLTSFRDGLQELIDALVRVLGARLSLTTPVSRISDLGQRGFRIHLHEGAPLDVDAVVLACPAWETTRLVQEMDPQMAAALDAVPAAAVSVVHLGYRRGAIGDQPEGFGFLVPRGQGPRILGALWPSCIFDGRAPDGSVLMTVMIGGAHDPDGASLTDNALLALAREDLLRTVGIHANPYFTRIIRHPRGIPQYTLGHRDRLETVEDRLAGRSGLWMTGNSLRGISINDCVKDAPRVAQAAVSYLQERPEDPL